MGGQESKWAGTVVLAGTGSMHVRFVLENAGEHPGVRWVWAEEPESVWEEENRRAEAIREELEGRGVERFCADRDRDDLLGVMVLTGDGSRRLEEYERWSRFGVPVYLDKPVALEADGLEALLRRSGEVGVPWETGSSWRFSAGWEVLAGRVREKGRNLRIEGAWYDRPGRAGWCWYGIHGVELLCQALGSEVEAVRVLTEGACRELECFFSGGRKGIHRGDRSGKQPLAISATIGGEKEEKAIEEAGVVKYGRLLGAVLEFFRTGSGWHGEAELRTAARILQAGWASEAGGGQTVELSGGAAAAEKCR